MGKHIDLIYRADAQKGASDGGAIRAAHKAICEGVNYSVAGVTAKIKGLDEAGKRFCDMCPRDCIIEIIGGNPAIYQAEVIGW